MSLRRRSHPRGERRAWAMNHRTVRHTPIMMRARRTSRAFTTLILAITTCIGMPGTTRAEPQCDGWQAAEILPRQGHAMAFDSNRGVTVLFGGSTLISTGGTGLSNETWEL